MPIGIVIFLPSNKLFRSFQDDAKKLDKAAKNRYTV